MSSSYRVAVSESVEIECQEAGAGPRPFVLVHGYTGSRDDWREHMSALGALGRTLAVDQRGHGGSSNTGDVESYSLRQLSSDLAATLTACGADPCDLLGHSMGGMVALRYVLANPDSVRSLILMDTSAAAPATAEPARKIMLGVGEAALSSGMGGVVEMIRTAMEGGDGLGAKPVAAANAHDSSFDRVRPKLEQMDPAAFAALGRELLEQEPVVDRLGEIRCPTTVIVGEADLPLLEGSRVLAEEIDGAELVVIPEAAHQPQLENPTAWFAAVEEHLRRARASG